AVAPPDRAQLHLEGAALPVDEVHGIAKEAVAVDERIGDRKTGAEPGDVNRVGGLEQLRRLAQRRAALLFGEVEVAPLDEEHLGNEAGVLAASRQAAGAPPVALGMQAQVLRERGLDLGPAGI